VVVLTVGQLPAIDALPAPDANDDRFHTTGLNGMNPIIARKVASRQVTPVIAGVVTPRSDTVILEQGNSNPGPGAPPRE
jgi:hypothetical protein